MMFEMHYTTENQLLSLAHGMLTSHHLAEMLQMDILNMAPHMRNAFKGTSPLVVRILLVTDTGITLGLAQDQGELIQLGK
jgi:hypothetical protein